MTVEWIDSFPALEAFAPEWRVLAAATSRPSLCSGWDWSGTWWHVFGVGVRLSVLVCRSAGCLVGIVPLIRVREKVNRRDLWPSRVIRLLGTGEPCSDEVASEYVDAIVLPGYEAQVANALVSALCDDITRPWDVLRLDNQLFDSILMRYVVPLLHQRGRSIRMQPCGARYCVPLPPTWDHYLRSLSANSRARLRADRRRLARAGDFRVERIGVDEKFSEALDRLAALHRTRWRTKGQAGVFSSERFKSFHRALTAQRAPGIEPVMLIASLDGVDIGAVYTLRMGDTVHYYQSGFDNTWSSNVSLGAVMLGLAIEDAIKCGAHSFDMMKGKDSSYKARYGCILAPMVHCFAFGTTPRGRLLGIQWKILGSLRAAGRDRLGTQSGKNEAFRQSSSDRSEVSPAHRSIADMCSLVERNTIPAVRPTACGRPADTDVSASRMGSPSQVNTGPGESSRYPSAIR
jgi:CelD/BcsL family acetyltransferase involved in cellulose biosynthesis